MKENLWFPPGLCLGKWFSTVPSTAQQPSNNMLRHWLKEKGLGSQIDGIKMYEKKYIKTALTH